jgi:hypothetical protein
MTTYFVRHRVADFDEWMHRFESKDQGDRFMSNPDLIEAQRQAGVDPDSVRVEAYEEA